MLPLWDQIIDITQAICKNVGPKVLGLDLFFFFFKFFFKFLFNISFRCTIESFNTPIHPLFITSVFLNPHPLFNPSPYLPSLW